MFVHNFKTFLDEVSIREKISWIYMYDFNAFKNSACIYIFSLK